MDENEVTHDLVMSELNGAFEGAMDEAEVTKQVSPEMEQIAAVRARDRARTARWDLNVIVFLFGIMAITMILCFQGIGIEIVAPIAVLGLAMTWLVGWRRGRQLYQLFYQEELSTLENELRAEVRQVMGETLEEVIQKALRERRSVPHN